MSSRAAWSRRRRRWPGFVDFFRRAGAAAGAATLLMFLSGTAIRHGAPRTVDLDERLNSLVTDGLPLRDEVRIHWNDRHIPFIDANHDRDLAVGLGLVHAHLRLAQIDLMRRVALGRLSELLGPAAVEADHALRVLDFARAGAEAAKSMPPETRDWLDGFTDGINWHIKSLDVLPHEFAVLGARPEPWEVSDLLAVSRLASMDFTWRVWLRLLKLRNRPDWDELWSRLMADSIMQTPSVAGEAGGGFDIDAALGAFGRQGSNSYAVAPWRTANGAAIIANDPHLSISLPNQWLITGLRSPSYHLVGLMVPGVPIVGLGRNPWIAWGGTSLHGASSELVDLGHLPAKAIRTRRAAIRVRWGRNRRVRLRDSDFGPVISDARMLGMARRRPVALHWLGHRSSDEVTPFLKVAKARSWDDFMSAIEDYAVPALNMIYADTEGRIGQAIAAKLPRRPADGSPDDIVSDTEALQHWESFVTARDLPHRVDPPEGFVASANNAPPPGEVSISLFFSPDDRVERLRHVLSKGRSLTVADMAELQTDVVSVAAPDLRDRLVALVEEGDGIANGEAAPLFEALRRWDGAYDTASTGALAFELVVYHLAEVLHGSAGTRLYTATWNPWALLRQDLDQTAPEALQRAIGAAAARAAKSFNAFGTWGGAHRMRLAHAIGALPLVGRRYVFADYAVSGSNETLMKTAHGFSGTRHRVRFGANARHISDLSDPDANFFALLGGQDGWLGSTTFLDQLEPWRRGTHVRVPLEIDTVRAEFSRISVLKPAR